MALNPVSNFPTSLDSITDPQSADTMDQVGIEHDLLHQLNNDSIEKLEAKVGVNSSAVTASLDYKLTNAASVSPGHTHSVADLTGVTAIASELNKLSGATVTTAEIDILHGATLTVTELNRLTGITSSAVGISDNQTLTNKTFSTSCKLNASADENFNYHSMARQSIINGNFDIWQRGTSFANPATTSLTADRWVVVFTNTGTLPVTLTHSRQAFTPGALTKSFYFYRLNTSGAGSGFGTSDLYAVKHYMLNGTRYLAGAGQKITISFWAKSDISNKKLGYALIQNYGTGGSPTAEEVITGSSVTLTSSLTKYTVTFTLNTLTGKTFGSNNNDALEIVFFYMWGTTTGSTYGLGVSETFVGAGNIEIAEIAGISGDTAIAFQPRSISEEFIQCLRQYQVQDFQGRAFSTSDLPIQCQFAIPMQFAPTTVTINSQANGAGTDANVNLYGSGNVSVSGATITSSVTGVQTIVKASPFVTGTTNVYNGSVKAATGF